MGSKPLFQQWFVVYSTRLDDAGLRPESIYRKTSSEHRDERYDYHRATVRSKPTQ